MPSTAVDRMLPIQFVSAIHHGVFLAELPLGRDSIQAGYQFHWVDLHSRAQESIENSFLLGSHNFEQCQKSYRDNPYSLLLLRRVSQSPPRGLEMPELRR